MATTASRDDAGPARSSDSHLPATTSERPTDFGQDVMNSIQSISQPVEMSNLASSANQVSASTDQSQMHDSRGDQVDTTAEPTTATESSDPVHSGPAITADTQTTPAEDSGIGPASENPTSTAVASSGPQLVITLLMHSTETRHPYTIDEAYLKRRNVNVFDNDPTNMTVYTLKELILRDWRSEWESRPSSPTSIRLIHMGRMLDDKVYLKDSRFSTGDTPHIVHVTVKPQEAIDEEDARIAKGSGRERDGSERSPGCRCVLM